MEWSYAKDNKLPTAQLDNGKGAVELTADSVGKALSGATVKGTGNDLALNLKYTDTEAGAYPALLVTYEIVCSKGLAADKTAVLKDFLTYFSSTEHPGQAAGPRLRPAAERPADQGRGCGPGHSVTQAIRGTSDPGPLTRSDTVRRRKGAGRRVADRARTTRPPPSPRPSRITRTPLDGGRLPGDRPRAGAHDRRFPRSGPRDRRPLPRLPRPGRRCRGRRRSRRQAGPDQPARRPGLPRDVEAAGS